MCSGTIVLEGNSDDTWRSNSVSWSSLNEWDADWKSLVHVWGSVYWTSCPKFWGLQCC